MNKRGFMAKVREGIEIPIIPEDFIEQDLKMLDSFFPSGESSFTRGSDSEDIIIAEVDDCVRSVR